MATLSPPIITTNTHTPFIPKSPHLFSTGLRKRTTCSSTYNNNILCKAKNNNQLHIDRRDMLIGLGGMYGASMMPGGDTLAAPMAPDVASCTLTDAPFDKSVGDRCCPPTIDPTKIQEFTFEKYPSPITKIRRPAHLVMKDKEWLEDYKRATAIMKSLPMSDPRNFWQQARVHCAYCDSAYPVVGFPKDPFLVHANWSFASFHRWYLFFFERIMGKVINKPDFALPYWNWDHPDGMRIPEMYKDTTSSLYDPNRNENHLDKIVDLSYFPPPDDPTFENNYPDDVQIQQNLFLVRKQMLYPSKPELFFGATYRAGDEVDPVGGGGALEVAPHNNVHSWVGSVTIRANQDMGSFWSSGRDSLFYILHTNVDRMWTIWRNDLPGPSRKDINDPDYLNASFVFYDENANPVRVYIKDSFDTEKLGYKYEPQPLPWLFKSVPRTTTKPKITDTVVSLPKKLDSVITTKVVRPKKSRTKDEKEAQEEVLKINFQLGMSSMKFIKFDVFINDDNDNVQKPSEKTQVKPQYAGSFTSIAHREARSSADNKGGAMKSMKNNALKLAINNVLDDIGASDDDAVQVTIVPKSGTENIVITGISIEFVA